MKICRKFFHHRQTKRSGFATAGAGLRDQVLAGQCKWQTGRLYGGHLGVTELIEVGEGVGGEGQYAESLGHAGIINGFIGA